MTHLRRAPMFQLAILAANVAVWMHILLALPGLAG